MTSTKPNPGQVRVSFYSDRITRSDYRQPSQGEDNCELVADELLSCLGDEYSIKDPCPLKSAKRDSKNEKGFDFSIQKRCGQVIEVQVTRVPDNEHFGRMARAAKNYTYAEDEQAITELLYLVERSIEEKTKKTPVADQAKRILAIDGTCPSVGFFFFLTGQRLTVTENISEWYGVVVVAGNQNCLWIGRQGIDPCQCSICQDGKQ